MCYNKIQPQENLININEATNEQTDSDLLREWGKQHGAHERFDIKLEQISQITHLVNNIINWDFING